MTTGERTKRLDAAALTVVDCPFGGWPETRQAERRWSDVAGRWVAGRYIVPSAVARARAAIEKRGASRPSRAGEWGL